jgi:hypothetical protein
MRRRRWTTCRTSRKCSRAHRCNAARSEGWPSPNTGPASPGITFARYPFTSGQVLQQASSSRAAVTIRGISELTAGAPPTQSWPKRATDQPAGDREGTPWTARHYDEPADRKMDDLSVDRVSYFEIGRDWAPSDTDRPNRRSSVNRHLTRPATPDRRLRARLHHGPLSHQVIALAATGQLGTAAAGQIRLADVTGQPSMLGPGGCCWNQLGRDHSRLVSSWRMNSWIPSSAAPPSADWSQPVSLSQRGFRRRSPQRDGVTTGRPGVSISIQTCFAGVIPVQVAVGSAPHEPGKRPVTI